MRSRVSFKRFVCIGNRILCTSTWVLRGVLFPQFNSCAQANLILASFYVSIAGPWWSNANPLWFPSPLLRNFLSLEKCSYKCVYIPIHPTIQKILPKNYENAAEGRHGGAEECSFMQPIRLQQKTSFRPSVREREDTYAGSASSTVSPDMAWRVSLYIYIYISSSNRLSHQSLTCSPQGFVKE